MLRYRVGRKPSSLHDLLLEITIRSLEILEKTGEVISFKELLLQLLDAQYRPALLASTQSYVETDEDKTSLERFSTKELKMSKISEIEDEIVQFKEQSINRLSEKIRQFIESDPDHSDRPLSELIETLLNEVATTLCLLHSIFSKGVIYDITKSKKTTSSFKDLIKLSNWLYHGCCNIPLIVDSITTKTYEEEEYQEITFKAHCPIDNEEFTVRYLIDSKKEKDSQ